MTGSAADVNGISLRYRITGPDDGPAVLLIAGMGQQLVSWPPHLLDPLREAGLRLIAFDNRDVGESTWLDELGPADIPAILSALRSGEPPAYPYTLVDMAADAIGLLDHLGIDRAHLVGPSMGGMIAQRVAIDHPDRVASLTSVMSSTGDHRLPGPAKDATAALLATPEPGLEGYLAARARRREAFGSTGFAFDEQWERRGAEQSFARGLNPDGETRQYAATIADGDRTAQLRGVAAPALVVHGADDPLIRPAGGQATAEALPAAQLKIVQGMGHDLPPAVCSLLAGWLTDLIDTAG